MEQILIRLSVVAACLAVFGALILRAKRVEKRLFNRSLFDQKEKEMRGRAAPSTADQFSTAFAELGHEKIWGKVKTLLRPEIRMKKAEKPVFSKLGGFPNLPPDFVWPLGKDQKPLAFVAQVDLAESAPHDREGLLPKSGVLSFFFDFEIGSWGSDHEDAAAFRVLYFPSDKKLVTTPAPAGQPEGFVYLEKPVDFQAAVGLPPWHTINLSDAESDVYSSVAVSNGVLHKLLGTAQEVQSSPEEEVTANAPKCDDESPWRLLFQVDTDDDCGMMWGDAGRLYFCIRENDLKNCRFDRCWFTLQCY